MKTYQREYLHSRLEEELASLLQAHWEEIARNKGINVLNPDYERYYQAQDNDSLRIFTARDEGVLIGYSIFFISRNAHYQDSIQAVNDIIYIDPNQRGFASIRLLQFAEQQLLEDNVDIIHMHMKIEHDHPKLFKFLGYEDAEIVREKVIKRG